jgi:hypothetical protein
LAGPPGDGANFTRRFEAELGWVVFVTQRENIFVRQQ